MLDKSATAFYNSAGMTVILHPHKCAIRNEHYNHYYSRA